MKFSYNTIFFTFFRKINYNFSVVLAIILAINLLSACTPGAAKKDPPYWPKPPDLPRFVFEASLRSETSVIKLTQEQKFRNIISGIDKKKLIAYVKPYDIAARNGRVVVSDTMSNTLVMFDLVNNRLLHVGHLDHGKLVNPFGVGMDNNLKIYVADSSSRSIKIYDEVGYYLGDIGDSTTLVKPIDVAPNASGDRIYVVDSGGIESLAHRVVVFDREGNVLKTIGTRGGDDGNFNLPRAVAVAPDGTVYVLDGGNFRVQVFDADGKYLSKWGKVGRGLGDFSRPRGIAVDGDGNIYVSDAGFRNVQIFNPKGQLLMWIGGASMHDIPGEYAMPAGVAVDETNRIYIVDQLHRKVEVIRRLSEDEGKRILAKKMKSMQKPVKVLPAVVGTTEPSQQTIQQSNQQSNQQTTTPSKQTPSQQTTTMPQQTTTQSVDSSKDQAVVPRDSSAAASADVVDKQSDKNE